MTYFNDIRRRMPHFFNDIDVLEYVPHKTCKSIYPLFEQCRYVVINPEVNDLSSINDDYFKVTMSIDRFQYTPRYLEEFLSLHRTSSKFVMFSCATAGKPIRGDDYYKNLVEADFYNCLDLKSMFETHKFHVDYDQCQLYFWGVKKLITKDNEV